jgi:acyl-CoA thioesterase FadM
MADDTTELATELAVTQASSFEDWRAALLPALVAAQDQAAKKRQPAPEPGQPRWAKVTENSVSVRFTDCDPFGMLYNSRYIDYFINGRDFHMDQFYGLNLSRHSLKTNESYVVKRHEIVYLRPALVREVVLIRGVLLDFGDDWTFVESQMLDERGTSLKALMWSEFSYLNTKSMRRVRQPQWVLDILRDTVTPLEAYAKRDFDGRVQQLQHELRKLR